MFNRHIEWFLKRWLPLIMERLCSFILQFCLDVNNILSQTIESVEMMENPVLFDWSSSLSGSKTRNLANSALESRYTILTSSPGSRLPLPEMAEWNQCVGTEEDWKEEQSATRPSPREGPLLPPAGMVLGMRILLVSRSEIISINYK